MSRMLVTAVVSLGLPAFAGAATTSIPTTNWSVVATASGNDALSNANTDSPSYGGSNSVGNATLLCNVTPTAIAVGTSLTFSTAFTFTGAISATANADDQIRVGIYDTSGAASGSNTGVVGYYVSDNSTNQAAVASYVRERAANATVALVSDTGTGITKTQNGTSTTNAVKLAAGVPYTVSFTLTNSGVTNGVTTYVLDYTFSGNGTTETETFTDTTGTGTNFNLLAFNIGGNIGGTAGGTANITNIALSGSTLTLAPEPTTLAAVVVTGIGLLKRRRSL